MNEIKFCLDRQCFLSKPRDIDAAQISSRIGRLTKKLSLTEIIPLARDISLDGYTFCPATFKGGQRGKDNFEQQQLFVLDFDSGISFEEVKKRTDRFEIPVLFSYETFSSRNQDKFRVVFLNDISIPDRNVAEAMLRALGMIFPEADQSCCKDVSRMYYGGKTVVFINDKLQTINIEALFRNLTRYLRENNKDNHYKEKVAKFSRDTGIGLNKNGLLDVTVTENPTEQPGVSKTNQNGKNSPTPIIYNISNIIGNGEIFPNSYYNINIIPYTDDTSNCSVAGRTVKNHDSYRSSIIVDIGNSCKLFQEFDTGSRKLSHGELYGLSTNLIQVDSGSQKFLYVLSINSHFYGDRLSKWEYDLAYMKQLDYHPQRCDGFCLHCSECNHGKNILSTVRPKRGTLERIIGYQETFDTVDSVKEDVYRAIHKAHLTYDKLIQIIKAMTGIGKSTTYLNLMSEYPEKRFLVAAPTNLLKNEIYANATRMALDVGRTPSLEEIKAEIPPNIWKNIQWLYKIGRHRFVYAYIIEILKKCETQRKKDIPCLRKYLAEREKLKNFNGSLITTHRYLLSMDEKRLREYDTIIIDEDIILKSIIANQGEITISELKKLLKETTHRQLGKKIRQLLKLSEMQSCIELDGFKWDDDEEESDGISMPFDIPSFCIATKFYVRRKSKEKNLKEDTIVFIKPVTLKKAKYIMVSATVDEKICHSFFGKNNNEFYECKDAEYEGELYQYPGRTMSRSSIDEDPGVVKRLMKRFDVGADRVISFKQYKVGPLYFGNTEGSNTLEGKDILVIGTPYHAEFLYKLVAFTMGFDFDESSIMKGQLVTYNGYRFWFTTFEDENLRAIHFWMIESELEQAVGRVRLLWHKCTVHLFSIFPLRQAMIINDFDYDKE